jgi:hypothetical protein
MLFNGQAFLWARSSKTAICSPTDRQKQVVPVLGHRDLVFERLLDSRQVVEDGIDHCTLNSLHVSDPHRITSFRLN